MLFKIMISPMISMLVPIKIILILISTETFQAWRTRHYGPADLQEMHRTGCKVIGHYVYLCICHHVYLSLCVFAYICIWFVYFFFVVKWQLCFQLQLPADWGAAKTKYDHHHDCQHKHHHNHDHNCQHNCQHNYHHDCQRDLTFWVIIIKLMIPARYFRTPFSFLKNVASISKHCSPVNIFQSNSFLNKKMYHHHHWASLCSWATEAQVPKEVHRVRGRGGHGLADQLGRHRLVGLWWKGHGLDTFENTTDTFAFVLLLNLVFSLWRRCSWPWAPVTAVISPFIGRQRRMDSTKTAH